MEGSEVRGKGYFCLRFAHCHNGFHIGVLRVYDRVGNGPRQTWWSLAGYFGLHWHTAAVQLNLTSVTEVGVFYARYMTYMSPGKSTGRITRAHAHTRTRAHAHTRTRAHAHTRTRAHAHTRTRAHAHTRTHVHPSAQINVHASTHARTYVCRYTRMHTYIETRMFF